MKKGYVTFAAIGLIALLGFALFANTKTFEKAGAPVANVQRSLIPEADDQYYIGTTSPSNLRWKTIYASSLELSGSGTTTIPNLSVTGNLESVVRFYSYGNVNVPSINATSTTATSTFSGGLAVNTGLFVQKNGNILASTFLPTADNSISMGSLSAPLQRWSNINMSRTLTISAGNSNITHFAISSAALSGASATAWMDVSGTWNTTGAPTAFKLNVTNTASNAASKLIDLQTSGASRFNVLATGEVGIGTTSPAGNLHVASTDGQIYLTDTDTGADLKHIRLRAAGGSLFLSRMNDALSSATDWLTFDSSGTATFPITTATTTFSGGLRVNGSLALKTGGSTCGFSIPLCIGGSTQNGGIDFGSWSSWFVLRSSGATALGGNLYTKWDDAAWNDLVNMRFTSSLGAGIIKIGGTEGSNSGLGNFFWYSTSTATADVKLNNTTDLKMTLNKNGRLGLGVNTVASGGMSNPDAFLTIGSDSESTDTNAIGIRSLAQAIVSGDQIGGIGFVSRDSNLAATGATSTAIKAIASATHTAAEYATDLTFWTASGTTLDEKMRIKSSGNVGISTSTPGTRAPGTASPAYSAGKALDINGGANDPLLSLLNTQGDTGIQIWSDSSGAHGYFDSLFNGTTHRAFNFRTRTMGTPVDAMTILGSGNVGIGTTTPRSKLDIYNGAVNTVASAVTIEGALSAVNAGHSIDFLGGGSSGVGLNPYARIAGVTDSIGAGGVLSFYTATNLASASSERLRIDRNGNVGIGTTSPSGKLEVGDSTNGGIQSFVTNSNTGTGAFSELGIRNGYSSTADSLRLMTLGTGFTTSGRTIQDSALIDAGANLSGGLSLSTAASAPIRFYTNGNNERVRITESGLVGIGSTTPVSKLSISGGVTVTPTYPADAATVDLDWDTTTNFATTFAASRTISFSNVKVGECIRLFATNSTGSALTFTWPSTVTWGDSGAPTSDAVNGGTDIFTFCTATSTGTVHGRFAD